MLVLDTGVLLAALDREDPGHGPCVELVTASAGPLVVPAPVLTELDHLLARRSKSDLWMSFVEDLAAGAYVLHQLSAEDVVAAARLQARYADLRIGFVDAAVFHTCVELGATTVATLDRRRFSALRTGDGRALGIVP